MHGSAEKARRRGVPRYRPQWDSHLWERSLDWPHASQGGCSGFQLVLHGWVELHKVFKESREIMAEFTGNAALKVLALIVEAKNTAPEKL